MINSAHFPPDAIPRLLAAQKQVNHPQKYFFLPNTLASLDLSINELIVLPTDKDKPLAKKDNQTPNKTLSNEEENNQSLPKTLSKEEIEKNFITLLEIWRLAMTEKVIAYSLRGGNKMLVELLIKYYSPELRQLDEAIQSKAYELKEKSKILAEESYRNRQNAMVDSIRELIGYEDSTKDK